MKGWLISDIWNDGFCDISHFIGSGTDSTGRTMDIDFTLKKLGKAMEKKAGYDAYINSLTGAQYDDLKDIWSSLSPEIDRLYAQLQAQKPAAGDNSYDFDLGLYDQYSEAFEDEIDNLENAE